MYEELLGQAVQAASSGKSGGGGGGGMLPMSFSGSNSLSQSSADTTNQGGASAANDTNASSKAAKIFNITMGHGNTPANTNALSQSDEGGLDWKKIALYGIIAVTVIVVVKLYKS